MFGSEKRLEDHLLLLLGHAFAGVVEDHAYLPRRRCFNLDTQHPALGHGLQGIGKQAIENLREQHLLADDRWNAFGREPHLDVRAFDQRFESAQRVVDGQHQIDLFVVVIDRTQRHQQLAHPA
ncbi:hypothetical protein D3C85_1453120 [compost metagenome]